MGISRYGLEEELIIFLKECAEQLEKVDSGNLIELDMSV